MQRLLIAVFFVVTFADFATSYKAVPGILRLLPEMLTVVIIIAILLKGVRHGLTLVPAKYWFVFGSIIVVILCGIATNDVGTGPTLAGMRYYLRGVPMFLVPAVAAFTPKDLRQQFRIVLGLALVQLPISIVQRYIVYSEDRFSGDDVRGTLMSSGIMSTALICVAVVLTAFHLRGLIRRPLFLVLFFAVLFPTTIDETKVTVIFMPLGLFAMLIAAAAPGKRLRVVVGGALLLGTFAAILLPVYSLMNANSGTARGGLVDFFTDQKQVSNYVVGKKDLGFGTKTPVSRGYGLSFSLRYLAQDPAHLAFGLGLGNASHSNLGEGFTGAYDELFSSFVVSAGAAFLLEIGLLGITLVMVLYWLVFTDSLAVAKNDTGMMSAFAAGWVGVVAVMALAVFYTTIHGYAFLSYLYWYFSGVVAIRRRQMTLEGAQAHASRRPLRQQQPASPPAS